MYLQGCLLVIGWSHCGQVYSEFWCLHVPPAAISVDYKLLAVLVVMLSFLWDDPVLYICL